MDALERRSHVAPIPESHWRCRDGTRKNKKILQKILMQIFVC